MSSADDSPLLICYDGSDDAKHAIESAGSLLAARPAVVVTVWQPTAALGSFAWSGATASMVNFVELDRAGAEDGGRIAEEGVRIAQAGGPRGRAARHQGHRTCLEDDHRDRRPP